MSRHSARQILAEIALQTDLPLPRNIRFYDETIHLDLADVTAGLAWATRIGAEAEPYINTDGKRYIGANGAAWNGWRTYLHASEDVVDDSLAEDDKDRLRDLAQKPRQYVRDANSDQEDADCRPDFAAGRWVRESSGDTEADA